MNMETFDFATAEKLTKEGREVKRLAWSGNAILSFRYGQIQLLDRYYNAFWDLTSEDKNSTDWICIESKSNQSQEKA